MSPTTSDLKYIASLCLLLGLLAGCLGSNEISVKDTLENALENTQESSEENTGEETEDSTEEGTEEETEEETEEGTEEETEDNTEEGTEEETEESTPPEIEILSPGVIWGTEVALEFTSSVAGSVDVTGGCTHETLSIIAGENSITLSDLTPGLYDSCMINFYKEGSLLLSFAVPSFEVRAHELIETSPVAVSTPLNTSRVYQFFSSFSAAITFEGSCDSETLTISPGENEIVLSEPSSIGTYNDCVIKSTTPDAANLQLDIPEFSLLAVEGPAGFILGDLDSEPYYFCPHSKQADANTATIDSDNDGWIDQCEIDAGTDPLVADSDGDGFLDGADLNPLDENLPFAADYDTCGTADIDITMEIPAPSTCSEFRDSTDDDTCIVPQYGSSFIANQSNKIKFRIVAKQTFNGTLVFDETYFKDHMTVKNPVFTSSTSVTDLTNAGYGVIYIEENLSETDHRAFNTALIAGMASEWINSVVKLSLCTSSTRSIVFGDSYKSAPLLKRANRVDSGTSWRASTFDGLILNQPVTSIMNHLSLAYKKRGLLIASMGPLWTDGPQDGFKLNTPTPFTLNPVEADLIFLRAGMGYLDSDFNLPGQYEKLWETLGPESYWISQEIPAVLDNDNPVVWLSEIELSASEEAAIDGLGSVGDAQQWLDYFNNPGPLYNSELRFRGTDIANRISGLVPNVIPSIYAYNERNIHVPVEYAQTIFNNDPSATSFAFYSDEDVEEMSSERLLYLLQEMTGAMDTETALPVLIGGGGTPFILVPFKPWEHTLF